MAGSVGADRRRRGTTCRTPERGLRQQVTQLKRVVADKTLEVDFFKGALQKIEARRSSASNLVVGVGTSGARSFAGTRYYVPLGRILFGKSQKLRTEPCQPE